MVMVSVGRFAGFFGRLRPRRIHELSNEQQAAKRVYDIAKNAGDVSSAVDIANRYGLDQSLAECDSLWDILRSKCSDDRAKGRHLLALVAPWSRVSGEESTVVFVEEALRCDPSLLPQAAAMHRGISSEFRAQLVKRMLAASASPESVLEAFRYLSMEHRIRLAQRCITYALEKQDIPRAYEIANAMPPALVKESLSTTTFENLIAAVLSLPATVGERSERLAWATAVV